MTSSLNHADSVALGGPASGSGSYSEKPDSVLNTQTHEPQSFELDFKEGLAGPEDVAAAGFDENNRNGGIRKRESTSCERTEENYWGKRRKNNEAARRSREKKRANDMVLERRLLGLLEENARLKAEVLALKFHFGMVKDLSDVSILPLSTTPSLTQSPFSNTDGLSSRCQPVQQGVVRTVISPQTACGVSSIRPCPPQAYSTRFYDDLQDECDRPAPREDQRVSCDGLRNLPHKLRFKSPPGVEISSSPDKRPAGTPVAMVEPSIQIKNTQQVGRDGQTRVQGTYSGDGVFGECGQQQILGSSCGCSDYSSLHKPDKKFSGGDVTLRSHISSLSQEVAQLRRLLSHQLLRGIH